MEPKQTIYYGVYVPSDIQVPDNDAGSTNVFFDKVEALKEVKKCKKARFKAFQFYHEALEFALHGSEYPNNNSTLELNSSKGSNNESSGNVNVGEKPSQFRGPKSQDLVQLRKDIENGNLLLVKTKIWENPRYLISSGDTPAILQEGARYNALHVAAKAKNAEMCDLILSTVGSPDFLQLLYGEENRANSKESAKILLDLYLNTPDKSLNETPLHFAVKFGAVEVVEVLVSYPECDRNVRNKYGSQPYDIICDRINWNQTVADKISALLEDRFYVPVLRSEDNCVQPLIGEPFSPISPPKLNTNPISPRLEIHAYAGPMLKDEACKFRKKWKTPPRSPIQTTNNKTKDSFNYSNDFRLQDTEKGLERVGRDLAKQFNVGWKEYWPFLGTFVDLTTEEGLTKLETFLKHAFSESFSNSTNKQNQFENSETELNNKINLHNNTSAVSPMSDLCKNFEACSLADNSPQKSIQKNITNNIHIQNPNDNVEEYFSKATMSSCLCIEKSCQIFANRIAHQILYQMDHANFNTLEALEAEIKHLKNLIASFMDDVAFNVINFQSVHSRISYLIANKLKIQIFQEELEEKLTILEEIIKIYDKKVDLFSSDDEELNNYNQTIKFLRRKSTSDSKQVICLVQLILKWMESDTENEFVRANTEEECSIAWANAAPCTCVWKSNRSTRKSSFIKKTNSSKYLTKHRSLDNVSRRLNFFDNGDELDRGDSFDQEFLSSFSSKNSINNHTKEESDDSSSSEYLSANSSPNTSDTESDDEVFREVETDDLQVYIEGNAPTRVDYAVFNAIKNVEINPNQYPNIYRWRHAVNIYPEEERMNWPSPSTSCYKFSINKYASAISTPRAENKKTIFFSPNSSWLRVTGQNSPLKSLKALKEDISLP